MSSVQKARQDDRIGSGRFVEVGMPPVVVSRSRRPLAESLKPTTKVAVPKPAETLPEPIKVAETHVVVVEAPKLEAPVPTPKSVTSAPPPMRVSSNAQADAIVAERRTEFAAMVSARDQPATWAAFEAHLRREKQFVSPSQYDYEGVTMYDNVIVPAPSPVSKIIEKSEAVAMLKARFNPPAPSPTKSPLTLATGHVVDGRPRDKNRGKKSKNTPPPNKERAEADRWKLERDTAKKALNDKLEGLELEAIELVADNTVYHPIWLEIGAVEIPARTPAWKRRQLKLNHLLADINLALTSSHEAYVAALVAVSERLKSRAASAK
jgi:hypothetical protein